VRDPNLRKIPHSTSEGRKKDLFLRKKKNVGIGSGKPMKGLPTLSAGIQKGEGGGKKTLPGEKPLFRFEQ